MHESSDDYYHNSIIQLSQAIASAANLKNDIKMCYINPTHYDHPS